MVGETKRDVLHGEPFPKWLQILGSLETRYGRARAEHKLDSFWRTLMRNTAGDPPRLLSETESFGASFARWFQKSGCIRQGRPENEWDSRTAWLSELLDDQYGPQTCTAADPGEFATSFSRGEHLRLFRTSKGYLGLGSECVQEKDSVWIVPGSPVPLILRALKGHPTEGNRYGLVGGTYLHGFMKGEAVASSLTGDIDASMESFVVE